MDTNHLEPEYLVSKDVWGCYQSELKKKKKTNVQEPNTIYFTVYLGFL